MASLSPNPRTTDNKNDKMRGSYLGPSFTNIEVEAALTDSNAVFRRYDDEELISEVALALSKGKAVGWMQGRMEFGPRALGARSIIADARSPEMQSQLNLKVKYRESFRPFAPSVLCEHVYEWFDIDTESPYMLLVADVAKSKRIDQEEHDDSLFGIEKLRALRSRIPAVTHVDNSARIQTVHKETNPKYYSLIEKFYSLLVVPFL